MKQISKISDHRSGLAECPTWHPDEERLYWTDIRGERLLRYTHDGDVEVVCENAVVGGMTVQKDGSLLLFMDEGSVGIYRDGTLIRDVLQLPNVRARFNDVVSGPDGRVLCGTIPGEDHPGHLYRLDPDGGFERLLKRVQVPNGMDFSPDFKRLYFTETNNRLIHVFNYDRTVGTIVGRKTFADFRDTPGKPDGLAVDSGGTVWSAQWGTGTVKRIAPNGRIDECLELPAQYVTSITFGGVANRTLFITTAQASEPDIDDGGTIFTIEPDVPGVRLQHSRIDV